MNFNEILENAVKEFNVAREPIRIIAHLDADGIAAGSILIRALQRLDKPFSFSIVKQLDDNILKMLSLEDFKTIFFVDIGSSYLKEINESLNERRVFILDHHQFEDIKNNFVHVNPNFFDIKYDEVSGAGVTYLFVKKLEERNKDLAYLAIIGAIGDGQESNEFVSINQEILQDAVESGKLEIKKGLRMFGMQTRPLHKVLEYSTNPYIPGVTGSEEGAINFLNEININPMKDGKWKRLINLNEDEMKKLITAIILKRLGSEKKPEDVLGQIYLLKEEREGSPMKDAKEFSTLLNSCGKLEKYSLGVGVCLGNKELREEAIELLKNYKLEIIKGLDWFYKNKKSEYIIEDDNFVIINANDRVKENLISTLVSIISNSNLYKDGTVLVGMVYTIDGKIKLSCRVSGFTDNIDLREFIQNVLKNIKGGIGGGHKLACGGLIPLEEEENFINLIRERFKSLEENVMKNGWKENEEMV